MFVVLFLFVPHRCHVFVVSWWRLQVFVAVVPCLGDFLPSGFCGVDVHSILAVLA